MARWTHKDTRVRLVDITRGATFELALSNCEEPEVRFAYVDDQGGGVEVLLGLAVVGRITISDQSDFMWLAGPRDCVLLAPTPEGLREGKALFRSKTVGEFCVEIYLVPRDDHAELIHSNDFCFK